MVATEVNKLQEATPILFNNIAQERAVRGTHLSLPCIQPFHQRRGGYGGTAAIRLYGGLPPLFNIMLKNEQCAGRTSALLALYNPPLNLAASCTPSVFFNLGPGAFAHF